MPQSNNTLASGTVNKGNTQYNWQVTDNSTNAKDFNAALMREYGKQLIYDFDNRQLVASESDTSVSGEASNVMARKYNNITLQTTNSNETVPTTITYIKQTPWIYKDQHSKDLWDEINGNQIGSHSWARFGLSQVIGGNGLSGLTYDFNSRQVLGTPTVTDWEEGETSRVIPVYMATTHKGTDSDYITLSKLKEFNITNPNAPKPPESTTNVLASGTANKDGKQIQWQVTDNSTNAKDANTTLMHEYGKRLSYDVDKQQLVANESDTSVSGEASNVIARKYNNVTLRVTDGNGAKNTVSGVKETPWIYKDQHSKDLWDEINGNQIGSHSWARFGLSQVIGGNGLSGLTYDFNSRQVLGTPTVTDWEEGETSRVIPVYMATTHKGTDSDYITLSKLKEFTVNKPQTPVVPPTPKPPVPPESTTNVLASGTANKDGEKIKWQVINNDKNTNTEQMKMYAQYLSYNPNTNALTMTDATAFTENGEAISARKFSNITLKITKDGKTTEENIKETPWFFKDQNSKNMWDSITQTTIGTQTFEKYSLEQKIGGVGLEGLSYDFLNKNFDGTPTIAWNGDEKIHEIPVYMASIHKGKDCSDYMTVSELKKFKAYKNRNDIFEGTAGINPRTNQAYKFDDLGLNNVTQTVIGEYNSGTYGIPFYIKPGETKTIPLRFYLLDDNRQPIQEITDEFMKVLNPEPNDTSLKKVQLFRKGKTTVVEMNTEYTLNTDYSITFTANTDAQDGDSYNTYGSKVDDVPIFLNPAMTPTYTHEDGITLHEKGNPKNVSTMNAVIRVTKPKSQPPKPEPPKPEPPKPEPEPTPVTPEPEPEPEPAPEPGPEPTPVTPEPEPEPEPIPVPIPKFEPIPVPIISEPKPEQEPEPEQEKTVKEATAPQTHEPLARTGSETSIIAGAGLAFLMSAFGALSLKRTRIGKHSK